MAVSLTFHKLRRCLRDLPLARKLTLFTVTTSLSCLILAMAVISVYQSYTIEKTLHSHLSVIAEVLTGRSTEAIVLNDYEVAQFTLRSLRVRDNIVAACLYKVGFTSAQSRLTSVLARYPQDGTPCPDTATVEQNTFLQSDSMVELIHPIIMDNRLIGHLYLKADFSNVQVLHFRLLAVFLLIMIAALVAAYWLAKRFSDWMILPLVALKETSLAIATHDDYTRRADKVSDDEVGQVIESFNQMLSRIELEDTKLRESEERFRSISASLKAGVFQLDPEGNCVFANESLAVIMGLSIDEILQNNWLQAVHNDDIDIMQQKWEEMISHQCAMPLSCRIRGPRTTWINGHIEPMRSVDNHLIGFIGTVNDITDVKNAQIQLEQMAFYDTLTGIANRRLFRQRLENVIDNIDDNESVALVLIDIDQFKHTNDSMGHDAGDSLLKVIAERLQKAIRSSDTVARLGSDEFAVILPGVSALSSVSTIVQNILNALKKPVVLQEVEVRTSACAGIALAPSDAGDAETLIKNADLALHEAKATGRSAFQFFTEEMNSQLINHLELIEDLREAVEQEQFTLVYQPQINLKTHELIGFEALLRWHHHKRGHVSPVEFIPVAEETGQILPLGRWVIASACLQLSNMLRNGQVGNNTVMTVNLSARQFQDSGLVEYIQTQLSQLNLRPDQFELELTESVLMENLDDVIDKLNALRDLGVLISIDDFGTGYSSLGYLKKLPVHIVKVDRSFVRDIPNNRDDMEITAAVIAMAHSLTYEVVAEGVETVEQLRFLEQCGCDYGQGYLFGKPLTQAELDAYCDDRQKDRQYPFSAGV